MCKSFLCDCHMHSKNSFDAKDSVMDMCLSAKEKKLNAIAMTDHYDCYEGMDISKDTKRFIKMSDELKQAKKEIGSGIEILCGIELGEAIDNIKASEAVLEAVDFDFILLSLHNLTKKEDFYYLSDFSRENVYTLLDEYFDEMTELTDYPYYDSLAHLTYPLRYILPNIDFRFDITYYKEKIDNILTKLIKKNKALEINSSGLRQKIAKTLPDIDIVKRFHTLGGKYITVGSDAHNINDVGRNISDALLVAKSAGFDEITIFKKHTPTLHKI